MSEQYRLVFSGEVLEGQHAAVVKKRLAAILKLDDKRMDVLFSGKSVVVKNATDKANAARYQTAFEKAGARLRVLSGEPQEATAPRAEGGAEPAAAPPAAREGDREATQAPAQADETGFKLMPAGSNVLNEDERKQEPPVEVDTDHLKVQGAVFITDAPEQVPSGPNVDHISLAELGALVGQAADDPVVHDEIDVDFDLAEVGAVIGALGATEAPPLPTPDFELAEPGVELDTRSKTPPPPAPDTNHIQLDDKENDETA